MTGAHRVFGILRRQLVQVDDHHVAQADRGDHAAGGSGVPQQDVAVAQEGAAVERNGNLASARRRLAKTVLLRLPVVEGERFDRACGQARGPFRVACIAQDLFDEYQGAPLS